MREDGRQWVAGEGCTSDLKCPDANRLGWRSDKSFNGHEHRSEPCIMSAPDRSVEGEGGACRFRKQQHREGRDRACDDSVPIPVQRNMRIKKKISSYRKKSLPGATSLLEEAAEGNEEGRERSEEKAALQCLQKKGPSHSVGRDLDRRTLART